jgi:hypothetical protein
MSLFNFNKSAAPRTITVDKQRVMLQGRRNPVTGQPVLMTEEDGKAYRQFIADYVAALQPEGMVEIQLAQRLAQDTWRINRAHAIEENLFALAHSEPYADMESSHPEIHAAMVQALCFRDDPRIFAHLALYEQRLTRNFHANMKLLLQFQSQRRTAPPQQKALAAAA